MAHRRRRLLTAVAAVLVAVGAASASPDFVRADLTFTKVGPEFRRLELTIKRDGKAFTRRLGTSTYFSKPKVNVRDLDADREPEVWVDTYTGGAHCCDESRFFRYVPKRRDYAGLLRRWGNVGYRDKNVDGRGHVELVSEDDRFAYVFTSFAGSAFPLQIWHYDGGRLVDVTRSFPSLVKGDADQLWRLYRRFSSGRDDPRGVLAAWVADQYLLGRGAEAWTTMERLRERGAFGPRPDLSGWPQGKAYLRALRAYLVKLGYA
jgi:hypothetical protein